MKLHHTMLSLILLIFFSGCVSAPPPTGVTPTIIRTSNPDLATISPTLSQTATTRVRLPKADLTPSTPKPTREIRNEPMQTLTSTPRPTSTPQMDTPAPLAGLAPISLTNYGRLRLVSQFYLEYAHLEEVNSFNPDVVFSPDSRFLAFLDGNRVVLWNIDAQRIERTIAADFKPDELAFNPAGRLIASVGAEGGPVAWDVSTGEIIMKSESPFIDNAYDPRLIQFFTDLVFSADGQQIITGSFYAGTSITFWDVRTGKIIQQGYPTWNGVVDVDLSPDGKTIYAAVRSGLINFFDVQTGERLEFPIESICWDPEDCSESIGSICTESIDEIELTPNGKILAVRCGPRDEEANASFCAAATSSTEFLPLISCYQTNLYSTETWKLLGTTSSITTTLPDIAFNSDGGILAQAVGYPANQVKLWNTATREEIHTIEGFTAPIMQVAISPNGQLLLVRLQGGEVDLYGVDGS